MIKNTQLFACVLLLLLATRLNSQLSGSYSIPSTYTSIASAISDLNTYGVSGPVTFNIAAGYTETVTAGGYTLNAIVGASSSNPVVFQKSGSGANPLLVAYTSGVGTPTSAVQNGVWRFIGTDYVTINGVDISDPNTTNPATMEFGYGFFKAGPTDGCQYNTIMNCVITLNRVNNAAGANPAVDGSRGIEVVNATTATHTTAVTVTSAAGSNSYNRFYGNTIQNSNYGVVLIGYADVSPFTYADIGNDVGGTSAATGNTIINYGGGGTTSPAAAVRTLAQYSLNVSYNTINNNNGSGVSHAAVLRGIYLSTAISANATVSNNTITLSNGGTSTQVSVIENASGGTAAGNSITIANNLISGCTNSLNTSGTFYGIYNSATAQNLAITGNTFTGNSSNATSGTTYLIYNSASVPGVINLSNNNLGYTFNNASTAYSASMYNIYNAGGTITSSLSINNNAFANYSFANVTGSGSLYFIYNLASCYLNSISNNTWNSLSLNHSSSEYLMYNSSSTQNLLTVSNNSIVGGYTRLAACGTMYCFYTSGSSLGISSQVITGNSFSSVTGTVSGSGSFYGIYNSDGSGVPYPKKTIANNVISNITYSTSGISYGCYASYLGDGNSGSGSLVYNNQISGVTTGGTLYGLYPSTPSSPSSPPAIYQNTVGSLTTMGASSSVYGAYLASTFPGMNAYKNKIYGITGNGATGVAYGMYISGGTNANYYNNLVGTIAAPTSSSSSAVNGIYISGGTILNLYYNTVYLNASSSGAVFGSNAIYASTSASVNLRNNIFVNLSTANGTGITAAYRRSSTTTASYMGSSNNNLFYAGTPSATNVVYHDGTTAYQTLASYKSLMAGADVNSVTENPPFASVTGTAANYLALQVSITQAESGGTTVSGISDDFFGNTRNGSTPDIGAWEGSYLAAADVTPPVALAWGFSTSACNTSARTFTVSLGDVSGVATGSLVPKLYYKLNSGAYASATGSLISGSAQQGTWSFNLSYSANLNDLVSYYLAAQDAGGNLMAIPSAGFAGSDVNTVSTPPTTPSSYSVSTNLSGGYTVGSTGTFTSLTAAASAYNNGCLSGAVTFSLTDALYSANETFPIVFQNSSYASAANTLLIRPAANVTAAVTSTGTSTSAVIKFLNARYITVDGVNSGGSVLQINNGATASSANIWLASGNLTGVKNITVKNLSLSGGNNTTSSVYGINASVDGTNPGSSSGNDNDNVTIQGNTFLNLYHGIYAVGALGASAGGLDNWLIASNTMGGTSVSSGAIGGNGVYVSGAVNLTVTANAMRNFTTTSSGIGGINMNSNINGITVSQNTLTGLYSSGTGGSTSSDCGIYIGGNVTNGSIANNILTTIVNNNTGQWGVRGMIIATSHAASNLKVYNNMLTDISTVDCCGLSYSSVGIEVASSTGGVDLDYNTINLFGNHSGVANSTSAALYISSSTGNIRMRNNLLNNTYASMGTSSDLAYALYSSVANNYFTAMDNNNYYAGGAGTSYVGYLGGSLSGLPALQSAFGMNVSSLNMPVVFTATNDVHLLASSATNYPFDNSGTPLAGLTLDLDGQSRSSSTPDIGADEFTATYACVGANGGTVATGAYSICSTQTLALTSTSTSVGANTAYQWQVSSVSGGSYTNVSAGLGMNTTAYKTPTLTAGTYYYILKTTCNASITAVSNEVTVSVSGMPNPVIVSTPSVICVSGSATLTASGAANFTWNTGATTNSIVVTPSASALYNVTGASTGCSNATSANYALFYSLNPTVTAVSASSVICSGTQATLTAAGANTYSWNYGSSGAVVHPTPSVSTTYTVTGYKANGCSNTAIVSMPVNASPTVNISGSSGICTGQSASLTASGASSYVWNTGATSSSIVSTPTANTTYTVAGTNSLGCTTTTTQLVTVAASLSISIVGPSTICLGQAANFSGNGGVTYTWSTGSTNATIAPSPSVNTTYSIVGASGTCSNTAVKTITVNANPIVSVSGSSVICAGQTATLTAAGASTYTWNTLQTTASAALSPSVTTSYTVTGTSTLGCSSTATAAIVSNTLPVIAVAQSASVVCSTSPASFTASGASTYTWNTGATGSILQVSPAANSVYTVSGTNSFGCVSTSTTALATYSLPVITIAPASATVCSLSQVSLAASGASTYVWNNGTAASVLSANPVSNIIYTVTGTSSSGCVSTKTVAVTTLSLPVIAISPASATVCSQSLASFNASGATTYTWNTNVVSSAMSVYPVNSTAYVVTGTSPQGCNSTATVAVTTLSLPVVAVSPAISTVCVNSPASFTATGAGTYTWNNTSSLTGSTAVLTPTGLTSYQINGTDVNGCVSGSQFIVFTNALPVISISASSNTVCSLSAATLTASGANSYSWSNSQNGNVITVHPAVASVYNVTGTNTLTGCSGTQTIAVATLSLPVISIAPASPTVCAKTPLTLAGSGAVSYVWSNNSVNSSINITPLNTVTYTVTGTDASGCSAAQTVTVTVNALPVITAASKTICVNEVATFVPAGASTYTMMPGSLTTYTASQGISGIYNYTITGTDNNGCVNKTTVELDVTNCTGLSANSFSGNMISVYPNPSAGVFTARFDLAGEKSVLILNSVGQLVHEKVTSADSEQFDISHLAKGVYVVKVNTKEASGNYRIIIE